MLSWAAWDNQKGFPDQRRTIPLFVNALKWWETLALLSRGIRSEQNNATLGHRPQKTVCSGFLLLLFHLNLRPDFCLKMKLITNFIFHGLNLKVYHKIQNLWGGFSLVKCKTKEETNKQKKQKIKYLFQ